MEHMAGLKALNESFISSSAEGCFYYWLVWLLFGDLETATVLWLFGLVYTD